MISIRRAKGFSSLVKFYRFKQMLKPSKFYDEILSACGFEPARRGLNFNGGRE